MITFEEKLLKRIYGKRYEILLHPPLFTGPSSIDYHFFKYLNNFLTNKLF
ncbi:hypothetical protein WH47_02282 [Habropoda laboriosa]|uniref:Histone-lysine N-methyltransferase SETMAR n=1 Tax=Habropoda laboriosa TaxID=597456 RepID=A0A0L7QYT3_9HYME|nr:hypothetical protein WH47_02282 [Habropoda laboriosa]